MHRLNRPYDPSEPRVSRWERFQQDAHVGVRGRGPTRGDAFAQAAVALTTMMHPANEVRPLEPVEVRLSAPTDEDLLVRWLEAVVGEMRARGMLFSHYDVAIEGYDLRATLWGEHLSAEPGQVMPRVDGIKPVRMRVGRRPGGTWVAQCAVEV